MSRARRLRSSRIALRALFEPALFGEAAVMQRERRLLAPWLRAARRAMRSRSRTPIARSTAPSNRACGSRSTSGATANECTPLTLALNARTDSGSRGSSPPVLDDLGPAGLVAREVRAHALARRARAASQSARPAREQPVLHVGHPQFAALLVVVLSSHTAQAWLSHSSTSVLHEHAEEPVDVRLADEQIERELDRVALNLRHALGAPAAVDRRPQLALADRLPRASRPRRSAETARVTPAVTADWCWSTLPPSEVRCPIRLFGTSGGPRLVRKS